MWWSLCKNECCLALFFIIIENNLAKVEECVLTGREIPWGGWLWGACWEAIRILKNLNNGVEFKGWRNGLWWAKGKKKIGGDLNRDMSDFTFEINFRLQRLWADSLFSLMVPSHLLFVFLPFIFSSFKWECQTASCSELVDYFGRAYLQTLWTKFKRGSSVALRIKTCIYEIAPKTSCAEMGKHESWFFFNNFIIWDSFAVCWWLPASKFWEFDSAKLIFFFQSGYHEESPSGTWDYCRPSESNVVLD